MVFVYYRFVVLLILYQGKQTSTLPEDTRSYFNELTSKYGHSAEAYDVITKDGYVLDLFRLPGRSKVPVLLSHGMMGAADSWVLRGNTSLAIALANLDYDVWIGNYRGNRYAKKHLYLKSDSRKFWNFSFHEVALYDLTATIDAVLDKTGAKAVNAIGHSMGNTVFYVLGSMSPQYNDKVNLLIALSPICYLHHVLPPVKTVFDLAPLIKKILRLYDVREVFGPGLVQPVMENICSIPVLGYKICIETLMFPFTGFNRADLGPDFLPVLIKYYPSSSSLKNLIHFAQVYENKEFSMYDYGLRNWRVYNSSAPPGYDLGKISMRIALVGARNDRLSSLRDVALLRSRLRNVVSDLVMPLKEFNHMDFVLAERAHVYLHPHILSLLAEYS